MKKLTVLYAAESKEQFSVFAPKLKSLVERRQLTARMVACQYNADSALKFLLKQRPQVCFVDIHEPDANEEKNQNLAKLLDLTKKFPDVLFCGLTRGPVDLTRIGIDYPPTIKIVSKLHFPENGQHEPAGHTYGEYLTSEVVSQIPRCAITDIKVVHQPGGPIKIRKEVKEGGEDVRFVSNFNHNERQDHILRDLCKVLGSGLIANR